MPNLQKDVLQRGNRHAIAAEPQRTEILVQGEEEVLELMRDGYRQLISDL